MSDMLRTPYAAPQKRAMPLLEFHRTLLSDVAAQDAFRRALLSAIHGGETVLDVGTGTGIHAMFACQAGARAVYAVETSPIIELARAVCSANGFADRITFIHAAIEDIQLSERVDVISAHLGLSDTLAILPEVTARHLRPGGIIIPASAELFCGPIESYQAYEQISFWDQPHYGMDFTPIRLLAAQSQYAYSITPDELLGECVRFATLDFSRFAEELASEARLEIMRDGVLHGVAMWYTEHLASGITLSSGPPSALHPKLWRNRFFPSEPPIRVQRGDIVTVSFQADAYLAFGWKWDIKVQTVD